MSQRNLTAPGNDFDDPTVAQTDIESKDLRIINAIKTKNALKETCETFITPTIDLDEITTENIKKAIHLISVLRRQHIALENTDKTQQCERVRNGLATVLEELDDMQAESRKREMDAKTFTTLTYDLSNELKNLYTNTHSGIVTEL